MSEHFIDSILLIDDNDTDNFIHKRIIELGSFCKEIVIKNSGKSALEYLRECSETNSKIPSVVFLDINMPVVDGFVFLFEFDSFPEKFKEQCKIVILSSSDNKKDIDRIVDNEYVIDFITKPLTEEALNGLKPLLKKN